MNQKDVTYQEKLNQIRMDLNHPNTQGKVFVLVEGESDIRLYRKLFNDAICKVERVPGGNVKLENCVADISSTYPLVIGIRDADFIHLSSEAYNKVNMFLTDYHDIEMTMIADEDTFKSLVSEFLHERLGNTAAVRDTVLRILEWLSYLKWLNDSEKLRLSFEPMFGDLISLETNSIDLVAYFNRILSKSKHATVTDYAALESKLSELSELEVDSFQLTNGHDFLKCFAVYIRGYGNDKSVSEDTVASCLRTSYGIHQYQRTNLYFATRHWAEQQLLAIY
jgi:hypothetical protein